VTDGRHHLAAPDERWREWLYHQVRDEQLATWTAPCDEDTGPLPIVCGECGGGPEQDGHTFWCSRPERKQT
jgi:hypothetical protein